ncbi:GNAT family N-acetyltransferase [Chryseobacterium sp. PTM-20240506]|uniref:GNAT family N-acetyltransferase n=1 Tax=unclassified Chryseobacterium TaxID=2593645 RepID=UPI001553A211|nr:MULTISPECIES: GNAT family N-acetyltransferase [unclassified Chryseobacterium]MDC8103352.1 GNAT family N-acetyltransferase [Chryseobacterium sp. B21-037]MDQ1802906.1 GNAT family N-acetyltransferase [Chryseobacterium sp. CKR4-1]WBV56905.1 GNAT family N-acetyltransferase [Chryseobacterium daecheongense]
MEIEISSCEHLMYVSEIQQEMYDSAQRRGTGIAKRSIEYLSKKISEGNAVVATENGEWVGFCYIETWSHGQFVANSGLIVSPKYRNRGVATLIKNKVFQLSRDKFPAAKVFGLTTGLAVMKINSDLGYKPVIYSELTQDEEFWNGCKNCVNYEILMKKERKNCLCTAMLFIPSNNDIKEVKNNEPQNKDNDEVNQDGLLSSGQITSGGLHYTNNNTKKKIDEKESNLSV